MSELESFSVWQFFIDGQSEQVRAGVDAETAVKAFKHYISSVGARLGMVARVIITDEGDYCCAEWLKDRGVTYPTLEMLEANRKGQAT